MRKIKDLSSCIKKHGRRYRYLSEDKWQETDWTYPQAKQVHGLIIDWQLFEDQSPSDNKLLKPALERVERHYGPVGSSCADRGFNNRSNNDFLEIKNIYNATCPWNPEQLQEKLKRL